jgi:hypothetical protein
MSDARAVSRPEVRMSEGDVAHTALRLVADLRSFIEEQRESSAAEPWPGNVPDAAGPEERQRLWAEASQRVSTAASDWSARYDERFKAAAVQLRDDMLSRLERTPQNEDARPWIYDRATNALGVAQIADDLERLATALVAKSSPL